MGLRAKGFFKVIEVPFRVSARVPTRYRKGVLQGFSGLGPQGLRVFDFASSFKVKGFRFRRLTGFRLGLGHQGCGAVLVACF